MNRQEYYDTRNALFSSYEQEIINKYGLEHLLDKIIYQQKELQERNGLLERQLDEIYQDLNNAHKAQTNLLPKKLTFAKELDFSARFMPSQYVSGDTYNVMRLDEEHVGIYQLDISGHGVAAALFSVSLSQMLNANFSNNNLLKKRSSAPPYYKINRPDEVIAQLNKENFFERYEIYFTMIYMVINIKTGKLTFSRAGHNPPVILRSNSKIEIPEEGGLPIGWDFARNDPVIEIDLEPGDRVFLYSDGICEARNGKKVWFGEERLVDVISNNVGSTIDDTLNSVISALSDFTGKVNFEDDVSILGIGYLG